MKVVWLSANKFGYELLKEAMKLDGIEIAAIITLSDKATTKMYDRIDKDRWDGFDIPVYRIENINEEEDLLRTISPDVLMMCGWRQFIKNNILKLPKKGMVGFHPTLLPKGRGPAPIINTILQGLKNSGVTMFYVDDSLDGGDIIGQAQFEIEDDDYASDVYEKVTEAGKSLIKQFLPMLAKGEAPRIPQNESEATYFEKRSLKDNEINLEKESPEQIYRKIRALSKPYKGAYIRLGDKKLIIWRAELSD